MLHPLNEIHPCLPSVRRETAYAMHADAGGDKNPVGHECAIIGRHVRDTVRPTVSYERRTSTR